MKNEPPNHDETMLLLSGVMESYSWTQFKPILYSPERLKAWIQEKLIPEPEEVTPLDPDDPTVAEQATVSADAEQAAMEFWAELTGPEQTKITAAFRELWGREGAASLPMSYR